MTALETKQMTALKTKTPLERTIAYFYNEHYGAYFGVESYQLKEDGTYLCGSPSGYYNEAKMKEANIPYIGIKTENKNILYI